MSERGRPVDLVKQVASCTPERPTFAAHVWRGDVVTRVVTGLALAGVAIGVVWSLLAPPVHSVIVLTRDGQERVQIYLGNDGDQFFVAAGLLVGLLAALGVVSAVLLWQWRANRGPAMVVAATLGSVAAGAAATGVGALILRLRYGAVDLAGAPVTPDDRFHYILQAPGVFFAHTPLVIVATLLTGAAVGSATYALLAAATERDDLGGLPPVEPPSWPRPAPGVAIPAGPAPRGPHQPWLAVTADDV